MNTIKTIIRSKAFRVTLLALVLVILTTENFILGYNYFHHKTPIQGVTINQRPLSNLTQPEIQAVIKSEIQKIQPLQLIYRGKITVIAPADLGAKINSKELSKNLIKEGRTGSVWNKLLEQNKAVFGKKHYLLSGDISNTLLALKILEIQDQINVLPTLISPDFVHDINKTVPAKDGVAVDTVALTKLIAKNLFNPPAEPLEIPTSKVPANTKHSEQELVPIRQQALALTAAPVSIMYAGNTFTLSPSELRAMLVVLERPDPTTPNASVLTLRLDSAALNKKLGTFARAVEEKTHAEFNDHDTRVAIYSQFYSTNRESVMVPAVDSIDPSIFDAPEKRAAKVVYLTFDDGPNSVYHPLILDILKYYKVKATFFLVGKNVEKYPDVTRRTMEEGHQIGNHTFSHPFLPKLSLAEEKNEIENGNKVLTSTLAIDSVRLFRPPYGGINPQIRSLIKDASLQLYLWDVDPRDWSEPSTEDLIRRVIKSTHSGSTVLLHSNHASTVKALPKIIEALRAKGYEFKLLNQ